VNGIQYSVGFSTFLNSMMVTKKSAESIRKTETINFVVLICNPRTYNLSLSENLLRNFRSVTEVEAE